jgi:cytochrome P450
MIRLGPLRAVVVSSARLARQILTERHDEFSSVPLQGMDGIGRLFGRGMVVADGEEHGAQRKRVMSVFTRERINSNAAVVAEEVDRWQSSLREGQEIDLADGLDRLARRIARRTLFGMGRSVELDDELEKALTDAARLASAELARLLPLPGWIPTPHNTEFGRVIRILDQRVLELVRQCRDQRGGGDDALSVLVREAERGLTDRELRDDLMSLFVAGNEATATALFWSVYHLANDWSLADELHGQAREHVTGALTGENVSKVPLSTEVFRESMRLYPAAHVMLRRTARELELGGSRLPKNMFVMVNGYMIHRDPRIHANPDQFLPGRFRKMERETSLGYIPFGAGPRTCIGNHFAMLQGPLSLVILNSHLRFEPVSRGEVEISTGFAIGPKGGYRVLIRRR